MVERINPVLSTEREPLKINRTADSQASTDFGNRPDQNFNATKNGVGPENGMTPQQAKRFREGLVKSFNLTIRQNEEQSKEANKQIKNSIEGKPLYS